MIIVVFSLYLFTLPLLSSGWFCTGFFFIYSYVADLGYLTIRLLVPCVTISCLFVFRMQYYGTWRLIKRAIQYSLHISFSQQLYRDKQVSVPHMSLFKITQELVIYWNTKTENANLFMKNWIWTRNFTCRSRKRGWAALVIEPWICCWDVRSLADCRFAPRPTPARVVRR